MKILWDGSNDFNSAQRTYKTYTNAVKALNKIPRTEGHRFIIAATPEGRFFPVALGEKAMQDGLHFHMHVA